MKTTTLVAHCGQLLDITIKSTYPSDRIVSDYFRAKKYIGSSERKFISEAIFSTIRNLILLEKIYNQIEYKNELLKCFKNNINSVLVLIQIILSEKYINLFTNSIPTESIRKFYTGENFEFENIIIRELNSLTDEYEFNLTLFNTIYSFFAELDILSETNNINSLCTRFSFPEEFINILLKPNNNSSSNTNTTTNNNNNNNSNSNNNKITFIKNNLREFSKEFNKPAPICIRTNSRITTREKLINKLLENNINSFYGNISPDCIIIPNRHQLIELAPYKHGEFEIQDEASQLVAFCVDPSNNSSVLDACAGAGGKSLHLATLQKDTGRIIASDIEFARLKEIPKRASRSGLSSIEIAKVDNEFNLLQKNKNKSRPFPKEFDYVLIDAPCTGSGTIRREPMKKYRITQKIVSKMADKQYEILTNFAKYVKLGGFLVYSTCSIFSQENEYVIKRFLEHNTNFESNPIKPSFDKYNIGFAELSETDTYITLYPFSHRTDGFFISKLKRIF